MAEREKVILEAEDRASKALQKIADVIDEIGDESAETAQQLERTEKSSRKAERGFGKLGKVLGGLGIGLAAAKAARLSGQMVMLAVDAEEAASAFGTTFGEALPQASRFVEDFAIKAGFTTGELQQMLAVTGNVVQGLGATEMESLGLSERMAVLAGDVASFSNASGGAEAVLGALQSAINGEREALKTYGLAISEAEVQQAAFNATGKTSADELTRLEKAQATVEIAYQKAGKAIGDLDRTQDSAANSLRRMQARLKETGTEIGAQMLPALEQLLPVLEDLIPVAGEAGSALADAFVAVAPAVEGGLRQVPRVVDGLKVIGNSAKAVGLGIGALAAEIFTLGQANTENMVASKRAAETNNDLLGVLDELRQGNVGGADAATMYANASAHLLEQGSLTKDALEELAEATGVTDSRQQDALITLLDYGRRHGWAADEIQLLKEAIGENAVEAGRANDEYSETDRMLARFGQTAEDTADDLDGDLSPALEEARDQMVEAEKAAVEAGLAFREELAEGIAEGFDIVGGAVEELDTTLDELEANLAESIEQQTMFYSNLAILAAAGYTELARELESRGPEMAGIAADLVGDMERAASLDDMIAQGRRQAGELANAYADGLEGNTSLLQRLEQYGISLARAIEAGFTGVDLALSFDVIPNMAESVAPQPTSAPTGAPRFMSGGEEVFAFQTGGIVRGPESQPVPAILHGGEEVVSATDRRSILGALNNLAGAMADNQRGQAGSSGSTINVERLEVNGAIGTPAEREAQAANLIATVERLLRS